eukprot:9138452-Prorocentrum_lima.AAC.1
MEERVYTGEACWHLPALQCSFPTLPLPIPSLLASMSCRAEKPAIRPCKNLSLIHISEPTRLDVI